MASLTTLKLSTSGLPKKIIKIYNIRGLDVVFEVEYFWNGWVKKNGVNQCCRQSKQSERALADSGGCTKVD